MNRVNTFEDNNNNNNATRDIAILIRPSGTTATTATTSNSTSNNSNNTNTTTTTNNSSDAVKLKTAVKIAQQASRLCWIAGLNGARTVILVWPASWSIHLCDNPNFLTPHSTASRPYVSFLIIPETEIHPSILSLQAGHNEQTFVELRTGYCSNTNHSDSDSDNRSDNECFYSSAGFAWQVKNRCREALLRQMNYDTNANMDTCGLTIRKRYSSSDLTSVSDEVLEKSAYNNSSNINNDNNNDDALYGYDRTAMRSQSVISISNNKTIKISNNEMRSTSMINSERNTNSTSSTMSVDASFSSFQLMAAANRVVSLLGGIDNMLTADNDNDNDSSAIAIDFGSDQCNSNGMNINESINTTNSISSLTPRKRPIRILSLDGGGTRGVASLEILDALCTMCGQSVQDLFDFVIGTSTGGLIAVSTALMNFSLAKTKKMYLDSAETIFKEDSFMNWTSILNPGMTAASNLENVIQKYLGEKSNRPMIDFYNNNNNTDNNKNIPKVCLVSTLISRAPSMHYVFRSYKLPNPGMIMREGKNDFDSIRFMWICKRVCVCVFNRLIGMIIITMPLFQPFILSFCT